MVELAGGDIDDVRGEHVTAAAAEDDALANQVLARFGWWTALGLANLANIFDPQAFVLGGGLIRAGEAILAPTRAALVELSFGGGQRPEVTVVAAQLGEHAGAIDDYVQGIRRVPYYGHVFYALPGTTASPEAQASVGSYAAAYANRAAALVRQQQDDDAKEDYAQAAKLFLQVGDQEGYRRVMREMELLQHQDG